MQAFKNMRKIAIDDSVESMYLEYLEYITLKTNFPSKAGLKPIQLALLSLFLRDGLNKVFDGSALVGQCAEHMRKVTDRSISEDLFNMASISVPLLSVTAKEQTSDNPTKSTINKTTGKHKAYRYVTAQMSPAGKIVLEQSKKLSTFSVGAAGDKNLLDQLETAFPISLICDTETISRGVSNIRLPWYFEDVFNLQKQLLSTPDMSTLEISKYLKNAGLGQRTVAVMTKQAYETLINIGAGLVKIFAQVHIATNKRGEKWLEFKEMPHRTYAPQIMSELERGFKEGKITTFDYVNVADDAVDGIVFSIQIKPRIKSGSVLFSDEEIIDEVYTVTKQQENIASENFFITPAFKFDIWGVRECLQWHNQILRRLVVFDLEERMRVIEQELALITIFEKITRQGSVEHYIDAIKARSPVARYTELWEEFEIEQYVPEGLTNEEISTAYRRDLGWIYDASRREKYLNEFKSMKAEKAVIEQQLANDEYLRKLMENVIEDMRKATRKTVGDSFGPTPIMFTTHQNVAFESVEVRRRRKTESIHYPVNVLLSKSNILTAVTTLEGIDYSDVKQILQCTTSDLLLHFDHTVVNTISAMSIVGRKVQLAETTSLVGVITPSAGDVVIATNKGNMFRLPSALFLNKKLPLVTGFNSIEYPILCEQATLGFVYALEMMNGASIKRIYVSNINQHSSFKSPVQLFAGNSHAGDIVVAKLIPGETQGSYYATPDNQIVYESVLPGKAFCRNVSNGYKRACSHPKLYPAERVTIVGKKTFMVGTRMAISKAAYKTPVAIHSMIDLCNVDEYLSYDSTLSDMRESFKAELQAGIAASLVSIVTSYSRSKYVWICHPETLSVENDTKLRKHNTGLRTTASLEDADDDAFEIVETEDTDVDEDDNDLENLSTVTESEE